MARTKQTVRKAGSPTPVAPAVGTAPTVSSDATLNQSADVSTEAQPVSNDSTAQSTRGKRIEAALETIISRLDNIERKQASNDDAVASTREKRIAPKVNGATGRKRRNSSYTSDEESEDEPSTVTRTNGHAQKNARNQLPPANDGDVLLSRIGKISSFVNALERSLDDRMTMIEESLKGISETMDTRSTYLGERLNKMDELLSEMAVHLGVRKSPE